VLKTSITELQNAANITKIKLILLIVSSHFGKLVTIILKLVTIKVHYSYKYGSIRIKNEPQVLNVLLVFVKCLHKFLVKFHAFCPVNSLKNNTLQPL